MATKEENQSNTERLRRSIDHFPRSPGVYSMKDPNGEVLYVGKARSLRARVRSYFNNDRDIKTLFLMRKTESIEYIVTDNEYEALILENTLIKRWKPHYNINLKDNKTYPVIRITKDEYPRIFRTRRIIRDGSSYFGPFPQIQSIDTYLELIDRLYPLRKCRGKLKKRSHPCLYYHIARCTAPCCGYISREDYQTHVEEVKKLLSGTTRGKTKEIQKELKEKMKSSAEGLKYEQAARYRDLLQAVEEAGTKQEVSDFEDSSRDYIAYASEGNRIIFVVLQMREGKLVGRMIFHSEFVPSEEEAFSEFIIRYYEETGDPPKKVFIPEEVSTDTLKEYFTEHFPDTGAPTVPKRGKHASLLKLAGKNAEEDLEKRKRELDIQAAIEDLKDYLGLPKSPRRIEGFDIAHLQGKYTVASMVSFLKGKPDKKMYRRFHVKSLKGKIDDYGAIREVVARRYTRVLNEDLEKPDLVLIDGGIGQVNAAKGVLAALEMEDLPLAGLAKEEEIIVLPSGKEIDLPEGTPALRVLQAVRDEAHRFATQFNTGLREKEVTLGTLEKVPGIGPGRSKKLLTTFGSIDSLLHQTPEAVAAAAGISRDKGEEVLRYLESELERS